MASFIHDMVNCSKSKSEVWRPYVGAVNIRVASCCYNWDVFRYNPKNKALAKASCIILATSIWNRQWKIPYEWRFQKENH